MVFGLSAASVDLVILGGLLVVLAQAIVRRDAGWIAATGLPVLLCADHLGMSEGLIGWGFALYAAALAAAGIVMAGRALGLPGGVRTILALMGAAMLASAGNAQLASLGHPRLDTPPHLGVVLTRIARTIDAPHAAP